METSAIFALIDKGLTLLPILVDAGQEIWGTVDKLKALSAAGVSGEVDEATLTEIESDFDAKLAEFNSPLPEED